MKTRRQAREKFAEAEKNLGRLEGAGVLAEELGSAPMLLRSGPRLPKMVSVGRRERPAEGVTRGKARVGC